MQNCRGPWMRGTLERIWTVDKEVIANFWARKWCDQAALGDNYSSSSVLGDLEEQEQKLREQSRGSWKWGDRQWRGLDSGCGPHKRGGVMSLEMWSRWNEQGLAMVQWQMGRRDQWLPWVLIWVTDRVTIPWMAKDGEMGRSRFGVVNGRVRGTTISALGTGMRCWWNIQQSVGTFRETGLRNIDPG